MIIKQVTIRNWRGVEHFETELQTGLNVLRGQNEAGKSSVVEAIAWALHRDLVGGARVKDEIAPIIPANDPKAKPRVEMQLEFPDCKATIRKTLAEDSAQRECYLTVYRPGKADVSFDQGAAQNELRRLMVTDGSPDAPHIAGVDVSLLVSAQGQSTNFVGQELSSSARSSIVVGEDGAIAPTSRLEKVRVALEKKRGKELFEKLRANAVDAAKKQTDAARLRDELSALREQHAKYSGIEAQIGSLRAQIKTSLEEYQTIAPRAEKTQKKLDEMRTRHNSQLLADSEVSELRRAHDEAKMRRDNLQRRIDEIANLTTESTRAELEWQRLQQQLVENQAFENEWKIKAEAAWREHEIAEKNWQDTREGLQAWDKYQRVCEASRERRRIREQWEQLQTLSQAVESHKRALENFGRVPSRPQISRWREQHFAIERAREIAAQSLKITFHLEADASVKSRADNGGYETVPVQAGEEISLGALSNLALEIPGIGSFTVTTAAREAQKQNAELDAKTRSMEKDLGVFGVKLSQLPLALETLEDRIGEFEKLSQQLLYSENQLEAALTGGQTIQSLAGELEAAEAEYSRARLECEPLRHHIPEGVRSSQANIERERAREKEHQQQTLAQQARNAMQSSLAQKNEYSKMVAALEGKLQSLEKNRAHAATRLVELQNDGLENEARLLLLDDFNEALWKAKGARDEAIEEFEALGERVSSAELAMIEQETKTLREAQFQLEKVVGEKRVELRGHCEQDPQTELDRLSFEIETREEEIARHEARLRGLAILEGALEAERHRLGRAIAAPLNEFLSPWLSELRGKKTRVEFDEDTGRITGVQTETGESTHVLPFGSHSGGMQEQTALALRLILAQASAKRLPSKTLPLVLDDPLTQTDSSRREGLWRVLHAASGHLQIIFVTCHESHLPPAGSQEIPVHWITLGPWREDNDARANQATAPAYNTESKLPEDSATSVQKPKRVVKKKGEAEKPHGNGQNDRGNGNGHVAEAAPETLSLW